MTIRLDNRLPWGSEVLGVRAPPPSLEGLPVLDSEGVVIGEVLGEDVADGWHQVRMRIDDAAVRERVAAGRCDFSIGNEVRFHFAWTAAVADLDTP